jgi:hypothetical protein
MTRNGSAGSTTSWTPSDEVAAFEQIRRAIAEARLSADWVLRNQPTEWEMPVIPAFQVKVPAPDPADLMWFRMMACYRHGIGVEITDPRSILRNVNLT